MSLGSDFSDPFDFNLTFLSGEAQEQKAYIQAIARRLATPRGALFYDRSYGLDIRAFLSDAIPPRVAEGVIEAQVRADERTERVTVRIKVEEDGAWTIDITPTTKTGVTFPLTFRLSTETQSLVLARPSA